jgi:REP element-mobilizing transposase RayT
MSLPREVIPGRTYMITRRCSERRFFLRPDHETNNAFIYCLAMAAARTKVQVLFVHVASNHYHAGIHDPVGCYPEFLRYLHEFIAKSQNALRGRFENFWSTEQTSVVRLVEPDDVLDKMLYALTNPVKDPLVDRVREWPGVNSYDATLNDTALTASRPKHFFRADGEMPELAELQLVRPKGFEDKSHAEFAALIKGRVVAFERTKAEERRTKGIRVLGREGILKQKWSASPDSDAPHFGLSPRIAARNKWARIEALQRNKAFLEAYLDARERLKAGAKDAVFPAGTWWLRRHAHVTCESAQPTA